MKIMEMLVPLLLAMAPGLYVWLRERRLKHLSMARLNIAESVTEMEKLMLEGSICLGSVSHDRLFRVMQTVQYHSFYPVVWNFFKSSTPEQKEFERALQEEIRQEHCKFKKPLKKFSHAYTWAFRRQHPWVSKIYFVHLCMTLLTLGSLLGLAKAVLKLAVLKRKIEQIQIKFQEKYLAQSGALLLAQEEEAHA